MFLLTLGLNHKTAPVEVREKLTFPEHTLEDALARLRKMPAIEGCAILSTCNRTEIYATVLDVKQGMGNVRQFLADCLHDEICEIDNYIYTHTLYDSVRHLFKVAAGLDSMILGETQILGQVRMAYQRACEQGATNAILNTLFQQAITVGKRVRTETEIDRNAVSISYAAVELGKQIFGTLAGKSILIIGAGKMSELTAKHLVSNGVTSVWVANRSYDKACSLAEQFGGEAIPFVKLFEYMGKADIVISCTSASHYVITAEDVEAVIATRSDRPLFLIDIAVPRDIDPKVEAVPGVKLYDIDDLQNVVDRNMEE
nr:glutamyl-tRNA reductase [Clostridia bacterium]